MRKKDFPENVAATPKVGDAVGVQKKYWFVAIVNNNTEKQCANKMEGKGYECYVPTQSETRMWRNGVRKVIDRIILPCMVLVHATETERKEIVMLPYVSRFMTNCANSKDVFGKHPVATIPEGQIATLKFMLGHAEMPVEFEPPTFRLYDDVRVIRGSLAGVEGKVVELGDATYFAIRVDFLGVAKVKVKPEDIERIK